jgi:hypothetical protein
MAETLSTVRYRAGDALNAPRRRLIVALAVVVVLLAAQSPAKVSSR